MGDSVSAVWAGDQNSYPATITSLNADGTISVAWADGSNSHTVVSAANVVHDGEACEIGEQSLLVRMNTQQPTQIHIHPHQILLDVDQEQYH